MGSVGKTAPDFELEDYFNDSFNEYKLSDSRGKWVILLFYPLDFTFVWPPKVLNFSDTANELGKNQL